MAETINLNRFRKAQKRAERQKRAEANRVAFGRTKAERENNRGEAEKTARDLDGKKLD
ncbi:MAG: DUF4169 family protein [Stellaceae bacterium]|jgi:hypothetical protein